MYIDLLVLFEGLGAIFTFALGSNIDRFRRSHANTRTNPRYLVMILLLIGALFWWIFVPVSLATQNKPRKRWFVELRPTRTGHGYWLIRENMGVIPFGDAWEQTFPQVDELADAQPLVQISPTGTIWRNDELDLPAQSFKYNPLKFGPIIFALRSLDGRGMWLLTSGGKVFTFGTAKFFGDTTENEEILGANWPLNFDAKILVALKVWPTHPNVLTSPR